MSLPKAPGQRRYPVASALTLFAFRMLARPDCVHFTFETEHDCDFWAERGIANDKNSSLIDGAGVEPDLFYPLETPRTGPPTKILFASRLLKSKGLSAFLMAARDLAHRPDVEFIVAGLPDDHDPDAIPHSDLEQMKEIRFLGHVRDMPDLLRQCDVVCLPTRYGEGIPRILIEAAATGLASIVSSHPGCREAVEDGDTGQILSATTDAETRPIWCNRQVSRKPQPSGRAQTGRLPAFPITGVQSGGDCLSIHQTAGRASGTIREMIECVPFCNSRRYAGRGQLP